jgi:hypothetical protein
LRQQAAQYRLVYAACHLVVVALLEAAMSDVAALVFACLGVALALIIRRAAEREEQWLRRTAVGGGFRGGRTVR